MVINKMGFFFRKGINLGLLKLNLSKHGIGVSFGVKGARLCAGPTGTWIYLGKKGVYYKKKLGKNLLDKNLLDRVFKNVDLGDDNSLKNKVSKKKVSKKKVLKKKVSKKKVMKKKVLKKKVLK